MLRIIAFSLLLAATSALAADFTLTGSPDATSVAATAVNTLGLELLHRVANPDQNALLSPYSIQSGLAMAYAGADGVTRAEMAKVLHYPANDAELHTSFAALRKVLEEIVQTTTKQAEQWKRQGAAVSDPITLTVANRLFGQTGYDFREPFLALVRDNYAAPFDPLDFFKDSAGATKHINGWIEQQTRQRIREVISPGALDELTRLVLVNAVYLKAPWAEPFEASATRPEPFHLNGGKGVDVLTMKQQCELRYAKGSGFCALALPYRGHGLSFLLFLPDKVDGVASVEAKLTSAQLGGALKWEAREVTLYLPKFKLEPPPFQLSGTLQALGMNSAFNKPPGSANFDRIAPRRPDDYLAIAEVFHKTFLNLDEQGTEAVAATAVHAYTYGIHEPPKPITVRVDHPFLFAIQHRASGACLFLGRVVDPR
jgi:serpin B